MTMKGNHRNIDRFERITRIAGISSSFEVYRKDIGQSIDDSGDSDNDEEDPDAVLRSPKQSYDDHVSTEMVSQ